MIRSIFRVHRSSTKRSRMPKRLMKDSLLVSDLPGLFERAELTHFPFSLQADATEHITAELQALYASFQRCLDLRDKYMTLSRQREPHSLCFLFASADLSLFPGLEDNPANYDGVYKPDGPSELHPSFKPWVIYPPPPAPHWKERDPFAEATETTEEIAEREAARRAFQWDKVVIPGKEEPEQKKRYEMDANGVYQVYTEGELTPAIRFSTALTHPGLAGSLAEENPKPEYVVPTIKEYFQDLDEILSVISDGSFRCSFASRPSLISHAHRTGQIFRLASSSLPREQVEPLCATQRVPRDCRDEGTPTSVRALRFRRSSFALCSGFPTETSTTSERYAGQGALWPFNRSQSSLQVDTHVHHSAAMNQKHLLRFIKSKMKRCPDVSRSPSPQFTFLFSVHLRSKL